MLNARTEVADLDIKLRDVEEQLATSQEQERDAINSHKEIRDQLEILDKDNVEAKAKLAMEMEKNTELGAELLTLVNQKETFGKMNASLNAKCETQEGKLRETEEVVEKRNKEVAELKESLEKEKLELENVRGEKQKVELELRKAVVGFEQSRLDLDKNVSQQRSGREESAQEQCGWISCRTHTIPANLLRARVSRRPTSSGTGTTKCSRSGRRPRRRS